MAALDQQSEVLAEPRSTRDKEPAAASGEHDGVLQTVSDQPRGLLLVGLFKMSKALFFMALGAGALHLVHRDLGDVVMSIAEQLRLDPEGRFVGFLMDRSDLIGGHQLRQISMASFGYSLLCIVEGTGLLLGKSWAEYFTVILTVLGLPIELFELARHATVFKVGALLINLLVLVYLLVLLKRKRNGEPPRSGSRRASHGAA